MTFSNSQFSALPPLVLEVLIHHHCSRTPFPCDRVARTVAREALEMLLKLGVLYPVKAGRGLEREEAPKSDHELFNTTKLGDAWMKAICATPLPVGELEEVQLDEQQLLTVMTGEEVGTCRDAARVLRVADPVAGALAQTTALVRGYVGACKDNPKLTNGMVPRALLQDALAIAALRVFQRVRFVASDTRKSEAQEALRRLEQVANGLLDIRTYDSKAWRTATPEVQYESPGVGSIFGVDNLPLAKMEAKDLTTELYREYTFPGGNKVIISDPVKLYVSKNGHRVSDKQGHGHYIPNGWVHLEWENRDPRVPINF